MRKYRAVFVLVLGASCAAPARGQDGVKDAGSAAPSARVDFHGDPLPVDAVLRLGSARLQAGRIRDIAFSPDGNVVASACGNHAVHLWDAATGKRLRLFTSDDRDKAFSPTRWLHCLAFSPDGQRLACGEHNPGWQSRTVRVWEVASGKLVHTIEGQKGGVLAVAFSPDGAILAAAGFDSTVALWNANTGASLRQLSGHSGPVRSMMFSPKGNVLVTAGDDRTIRLWDVATGQESRKLMGHQAEVESVCFSPDGRSLISGSRDQTVRLWDPATGKEGPVLRGHQDAVLRVACAPDGKMLASAGKDHVIHLWDVALGKKVGAFDGGLRDVTGLCFAPHGKTLASCTGDRVVLWNLETGKEVCPRPGHQASVRAVHFFQDGTRLVSVGLDGMARWWDWHKGAEERSVPWKQMPDWRTFSGPETPLIAVGPDRIALATSQGSIQLLDTKSGQEIGWLKENQGLVAALDFAADGKTLASSHRTTVQLWDVAALKVAKVLPEDPAGTKFVCFAPGGKLLLAGNKASRLWDVAADKPVRELPLAFDKLRSAAVSPDGRVLAYGDSSGNVGVWDLEGAQEPGVLPGLRGYVTALAFSPDGRTLAAGGWRSIKTWEVGTGRERRHFQDFEENATALEFTPDGRFLASGVGDNSILIWDIPGKALAAQPPAGEGPQVLAELWRDLAAMDGATVHNALWGLVARQNKAVPYLKTLLKPASEPEVRQIDQLTKDLDSELFPVREKASKELQNIGEVAEPALKKLLANPPSLEVEVRVKALLEELSLARATPERLQALRAVEALEYMGTPEARGLLQELACGSATARLTRAAAESLARLKK